MEATRGHQTIHILNGDATYHVFKAAHILGDVLIWREILSEGPVSSSDLWKVRKAWMEKNYKVSPSDYERDVIAVANHIKDLHAYDELILWFEYDLVCQINLIYLLSAIQNAKITIPVYLICPEKIEGMPAFKGLGELSPAQLENLLPGKVKLGADELALAAAAWDVYVQNDQVKTVSFLNRDFGKLSLLKKALTAHLKRFPDPSTGLNLIQQLLLDIHQSGIHSKKEIYEAFWAKAPVYGMGDLQIDGVLKQLEEKGLVS